MTSSPEESPPCAAETPPRRSFLTGLAAIVAGSAAGLVPLVSGVLFFLDPITRKSKGAAGAADGMLRAANLVDLPADGTPVRFTLRSDITDAWTIYRDRVLGSVYLRLMPNGQVIAFNDTCPHLGCKVDYQGAQSRFFCPCHQSAFSLDGERQNLTPPRGLDVLDAEIRDGVVWVKYQNFRTATPEKKVVQ
jgi:menaquinol-cytochrome c reductase iron-sulfur subunit